MRKQLVLSVLFAASAVCAVPASAATTLGPWVEQTTSFTFTDGGVLGRSVGDVISYTAIELSNGVPVATKSGQCLTTSQAPNGDQIAWCHETITFNNGSGHLYAQGNLNETAMERGVAQNLPIIQGDGAYANKSGTENLLQVRYPDQFIVNITLK